MRSLSAPRLACTILFVLFANTGADTSFYGQECEYSVVPICKDTVKHWIFFPNFLGHSNQSEITGSSEYKELKNYTTASKRLRSQKHSKLLNKCIIKINKLACGILTPKCKFQKNVDSFAAYPCPNFCSGIQKRCQQVLSVNGMVWPSFVQCKNIPAKNCIRQRKSLPMPHRKIFSKKDVKINHQHHNTHAALRQALKNIVHVCSNITRLYKIGQSVQGRSLLVLEVSKDIFKKNPLKPKMKLVGNIHGDEVLGRELIINYAKYLCNGWLRKRKRVVRLIETTSIHLLPSMNPDGHYKAAEIYKYIKLSNITLDQEEWNRQTYSARTNTNGYDLNRSFPDLTTFVYQFAVMKYDGPNNHLSLPTTYKSSWSIKKEEIPEVISVINWITRYPFVLSAQLHGGALVANFPYDLRFSSYRKNNYVATPDDDVFRYLSKTYATKHKTMSSSKLNRPCQDAYPGENFGDKGGITNGADWYSVRKGMQDFNYLHTNCFEITLELGCQKFTREKKLKKEWHNNLAALNSFVQSAQMGIKGIVIDTNGVPIRSATILVKKARNLVDIKHDITTSMDGNYWRLLTVGDYLVVVKKYGYQTNAKQINVKSHYKPYVLNFTLSRINEEEPR